MTTDNRKVQLEVEVDATKAKTGFQEIKTSASDMAQAVQQSGQQAAAGLNSVGKGGDGAADNLDRATKSIIASIQRTTAVMEAGERGTSKYFTAIAQQRGADTTALQPYLAQLDQAVAKSKAASQALNATDQPLQQLGISAKATAAAMRGVPAQFTDIITSIQGGQAPLTVLLQQGGQLKDMFGGIGPAAKSLGGYVVGLINPFTLAAAAVGGLAFAYAQGSKEADAYAKSIIMTGNAAGTSLTQLQAMAVRVDAVVGTQAAAAEALAKMAGTGEVASANLEQFTAVALKMEREVGTAVEDTVKQFAELGKSPVEASAKLNDQYHYLTASVYEQIRALRDQGKETEAATLAQKTYADAMETRTAQLSGRLGTIERAWRSIKDAAKEAWDSMLNVGRADTVGEQLAKAQQQLQDRLSRGPLNDNTTASFEKGNEALRQRIAFLSESVRLDTRGAEAAAERIKADEAGIRFANLLYEGRSKQQKAEAEIAKARADGLAAGRSELEIQKAIGIIREKYKETGSKGTNDSSELANLRAKIVAEQKYTEQLIARGKEADKLNEGEKLALQYTEQLKGKLDDKTRAQKESALAAANELAAIQKAQGVIKDRIQLEADLQKQQDKTLESAYKSADSIRAQALAQEEANATFDLGKSALAALTLKQQKKSLADLEATDNVIPGYVEALRQQIAEQERYVEALQKGESLTAGKEAAKVAKKAAADAAKEWQKSADEINQALTDALMDGFSAGKDFAKSFTDSVKAMFNTMVLKPVISAIVSPVASAVTGAMGFSGTASAASSALSGGSSLFSAGSTLAGVGSFMGELGTGLLASTQTALGMTATAAQASYAASMGVAAQTGSLMGSLGPLISAAPYLVALAGVYMLAKNLDHSGTPHTGGGSQYSAALGLQTTANASFQGGFTGVGNSASTLEFTSGIAQSVVGILDSTATTFGKTAGYQAAASFADDSSKDGAWGSLLIKNMTGVITDWQATADNKSFRTFSDGTAGNNEYLAAVAQDVRSALNQLDLPAWASGMLDALGDAPALDQLAATVAQINATQTALAAMGESLAGFADLSDNAVQSLIAASGGIDKLSASAASYYQNFYTEEERLANTRRQTLAALGDVGVETGNLTDRSSYRTYVEYLQSIVDTEPAAAGALAAMLDLSDEFASFVPAVESVADAVDRTASDIASSISKLQADTANLQVELLAAGGDTTGAAALQRSLDTAGFTDAELAIYDYNTALQAQIDTLTAAAAVAEQRTGIENTLLQALGETATLRQRELAALDPSNRALQSMIYTVTDAQSAISGLTTDIARLDQIAAQASTLSNSIQVALGGTDNTEAGLWATVNNAAASAEDRLTAVGSLINSINTSISTDTAAAQKALTDGATASQAAIESANTAMQAGYTSQLEAAQKMVDLGKTLRDYVQGLLVGSLSALTPEQQLAQARQDYEQSLSGARAGDTDAQAALTGNASTYLELARSFDAESYRSVFADVTGTLGNFGTSALTEGQQAAQAAQSQLDQLTSIGSYASQTTAAVLTGNVISDSNRAALESLLGLTTQIEAAAVIDRADKQAQITIETERMEAIRASLSDDGVIAASSLTTAGVMTSFAAQQASDNATLVTEIKSLNARIAQLEATIVSATGAQIQTAVTVGQQTAQAVSTAVSVAVDSAANAPVVA